jgi:CBS domain-containing protein
MKLSELLVDAWVALPLEAANLGEALRELLRRVYHQGLVEKGLADKLARDLSFGSTGEVIRVNESVVVVLGSLEALEGPSVAVGVSPVPFVVTAEGTPERGRARAVILLLVPGKLTGARQDIVPVLSKALRDPERTERLLRARTLEDIRGIKELMDAEFQTGLVVEDALVGVKYRVYPGTPMAEVVDLIVRRGVHAVPVVGDRYEVLGILTSGDALEFLLRRGGREGDRAGAVTPAARDFMTRTVLCVSEEQALSEAANMMVNRDVEQLPVVRDGELVGFITRDSILRALHRARGPDKTEPTESESNA